MTRSIETEDRLPLPDIVKYQAFPLEGNFRVKALDPPVIPEPLRLGDPGGKPCTRCPLPDTEYIWTDKHWRLTSQPRPTGLPFIGVLETREHLDLDELTPELAHELGPMMLRIKRAARSLNGVARVHIHRWGDGGAHMHMFFFARPVGVLQARGLFLTIWREILPPLSREEWWSNLQHVARAMAAGGGSAHI